MSCWFKQGKTFNEPVCQFCFGSTNQLLSFQNDEGENISVLEWRDKHFIKRRFPTFSIRIQSFEDDHINSYYLGDLIQLVIDLWLPQNESPVHQHYQIVHIIIVGGYSLLHHFHYHHVFDSLVRPYVPMQCLLRRLVIHPASILLRVWHLRHNFLVTLHCVEKTVQSNRHPTKFESSSSRCSSSLYFMVPLFTSWWAAGKVIGCPYFALLESFIWCSSFLLFSSSTSYHIEHFATLWNLVLIYNTIKTISQNLGSAMMSALTNQKTLQKSRMLTNERRSEL